MSDGQPRQVQCKLGDVDADGNWQLGSPASATDDKTQTVSVTGHKRRAPTAAPAPPCSSSGSDEGSDKDDGSDSGSSPSLDD